MTQDSRARLISLVRRNDADLAEAALLCAAELDPMLDVDLVLLRIDALTDGLRTRDPSLTGPDTRPEHAAEELAAYLAVEQGFDGDPSSYHDPSNALLHRVLDTRRGLPITLSILYASIARRLDVPAFAINLPGHVVTGIAGGDRVVVLDPFHGGVVLSEAAIASRVASVTGQPAAFRRSMLRPATTVEVVRRLLNNLTRDLAAAGHPGDALWTVDLKLALPNRRPEDHRSRGELLAATGRFDAAAVAYERYLDLSGDEAHDRDEVRRAAIVARARMN